MNLWMVYGRSSHVLWPQRFFDAKEIKKAPLCPRRAAAATEPKTRKTRIHTNLTIYLILQIYAYNVLQRKHL